MDPEDSVAGPYFAETRKQSILLDKTMFDTQNIQTVSSYF